MSLGQSEYLPGKTGAKAASFLEKDFREALRIAMKRNPNASEKELLDTFRQIVIEDDDYIESMVIYCFRNTLDAFVIFNPDANSVAVMRQERKRHVEELKKEYHKKLHEFAHDILMDHILSCGKMLRHAKFGDCKREQGWLLDLSKLGKTNEIIGKKLSEKDLDAIWKRHYGPQKD